MISKLHLSSFLEVCFFFFHRSRLLDSFSVCCVQPSLKANYSKPFTSKVGDLLSKWDATSEFKGGKLIILLESTDTFESLDCFCSHICPQLVALLITCLNRWQLKPLLNTSPLTSWKKYKCGLDSPPQSFVFLSFSQVSREVREHVLVLEYEY